MRKKILDKRLDQICLQSDRTKSNLIRFLLYRSLNTSEDKR